jgi:hypothetical protein
MKTLVFIRRSPAKRYLVDVPSNRLMSDVKNLITKNKHSQAMVLAFTKGRFEKEVAESELSDIKVDAILTENNISWDLTK